MFLLEYPKLPNIISEAYCKVHKESHNTNTADIFFVDNPLLVFASVKNV